MKNNFPFFRAGFFVLFIFLFFQFCTFYSGKENSTNRNDTLNSIPSSSKGPIQIHTIYEEVYPDSSQSAVQITSEKNENSQNASFKGTSKTKKTEAVLGSGIVINQLGYILTNEHVIRAYDKLNVKLKSGKLYEAQIIGLDKRLDLAILRVEADSEIVPVEVLDSYSLQIVERAILKYTNSKEALKKMRENALKKKIPVHLRR
ncbi:serine protease [Leptospira sp. 201903070]|uniref:Serine protease n=1 Tax=Leptospira ainlahdjerensis TaxID=2810033 RepID=A0ABS2UBD5_9LEPT|nr:S1C family serine protease [Leptospira ainlahdjerensis]MBM9577114.1 serine protease [Leptospira ainlahdjerensis]